MRSKPEDAAAPRRTRVFVLSLLSLAMIAIAGSTLPAGSSPARAAATTSEVTVVRAGYGDIRVEGAGGKLILTCTSELDAKDEKIGCPLSVPTGTDLDVQSHPEARRGRRTAPRARARPSSRSSVGWSRPECKSNRARARSRPLPTRNGSSRSSRPCGSRPSSTGRARSIAGGSRQTCDDFDCEAGHGPVQGRTCR